MEQWIELRNRYLYLLLEKEGKPASDKCSMCYGPAMIKCPDCFGAPSYCRDCVCDAHISSPFHRPLLWTETHYTPVSLQSLGFFLCLGHGNAPCPKTVEVCFFFWIHFYTGACSYDKNRSAMANYMSMKRCAKHVGYLICPGPLLKETGWVAAYCCGSRPNAPVTVPAIT